MGDRSDRRVIFTEQCCRGGVLLAVMLELVHCHLGSHSSGAMGQVYLGQFLRTCTFCCSCFTSTCDLLAGRWLDVRPAIALLPVVSAYSSK